MSTLDVECYVNGTKDYIDKSIHIIMPIDEIDEEMVKTKDLEIETNHMHIHEHEDGTKHSHEHTHYDDIEDHFHEHEEKKEPKKQIKKKEIVRPSSRTGIEIPKSLNAFICDIIFSLTTPSFSRISSSGINTSLVNFLTESK